MKEIEARTVAQIIRAAAELARAAPIEFADPKGLNAEMRELLCSAPDFDILMHGAISRRAEEKVKAWNDRKRKLLDEGPSDA